MTTNHEKRLRDMRRENRKFAVLLVIESVAALSIELAIGVWANTPPLFSAAPASQTVPA